MTQNITSYDLKIMGTGTGWRSLEKYADVRSCQLEMYAAKSPESRTSAEAEKCSTEKSAATRFSANLSQGENPADGEDPRSEGKNPADSRNTIDNTDPIEI